MRRKLPLLVVLGMTLVFLNSLHGQSFLTNGLVAYYPFNGNANDVSGNGRNGVVQGPVLTSDRFGNPNSAYSFNRAGGQFISVPFIAATGNVSRTLTAWIKTSTGIQCYISTGQPTSRSSFNLVEYGLGHPGVMGYVYDFYPSTGASVNDGIWHSVAASYDGLVLSIYVDGMLQNRTNMGSYTTTGQQNFFGKSSHSGAENFFSGVMDDIRVYNRALSSNEVASLYYLESKKNVQFVKMYTLDFDGLYLGTNYQLQVSTNVLTWTNWGSPFTATSVRYTNAIPIQRVDDWGKLFFRLVPQ